MGFSGIQFNGVRDTQRMRVYRADWALWPDRPDWRTVDEVQAYVNRMVASAWFRRHWPRITRITVNDGRGSRSARAGFRDIQMPTRLRMKWVVMHEVAHVCARYQLQVRARSACHGWEFCAIYLKLVQHFMGRDAAAKLKAAWKTHKVRFREPKKRAPLSPERRAALVARLAQYREQKAAALARASADGYTSGTPSREP